MQLGPSISTYTTMMTIPAQPDETPPPPPGPMFGVSLLRVILNFCKHAHMYMYVCVCGELW